MNALVVALVISLVGNVFLGNAYLHQRDAKVKVETETVFVKAAATECSAGTAALATKAAANASAAAPARRAAASQAAQHNAKADVILATPPAAPGDGCKSAEAAIDAWWAERSKP